MADASISVDVIARLNDRSRQQVGQYLARHAEEVLQDRPRPRSVSLTDPDRRFKVRLEELEFFRAAHSRRPHLSASTGDRSKGTEWALSHWLTVAQSDDRFGRLAMHRAHWLDRVLPSWRVDDRAIEYEAQWRQPLVQLLVFIDVHRRHPVDRRRTADPDEVRLAHWLAAQRGALRDGTLDPERRFWLDRQVPGWLPADHA